MFSFFRKTFGKKFEMGDRVIVSSDGGWKEDCVGKIAGLAGEDGIMKTVKGPMYMYWVKFEDDDAFTLDGDGPYDSSEVLSIYLRLADD